MSFFIRAEAEPPFLEEGPGLEDASVEGRLVEVWMECGERAYGVC